MPPKRASVHISDRRRSAFISKASFEQEDDIRAHESDEFTRFLDCTSERWNNKHHYMLFCILIGSGNNMFPAALTLALQLSGGAFFLLVLLSSLIVCLPVIYMETFLGRYARLTNCQMYRMAPIFFGAFFAILMQNVIYEPLHAVEDTELLVNLLKLLVNPNMNRKCMDNSKQCYDYKIKGPINDTCKYNYISMVCKEKGEIQYPTQHMYWEMYKNPKSKVFPYYQIIIGVVLTWALVLGLIIKGIHALGRVTYISFLVQFCTLTIVFILAALEKGSIDGLRKVMSVNLENIDFFKVYVVATYSACRVGLIIPLGYMSYSAYAEFDSDFGVEAFTMVMISCVLFFYYIVGVFLVCSALGKTMEVDPEAVVIPDVGIFLATIPEFLVYLQMPNMFVVVYYGIMWFFETVKIATYVHFMVFNLFDYFPSTKNFSVYIWILSCLTMLVLSLPVCDQYYMTILLPIVVMNYLKYVLPISISVETTMVSYFYGANRLCNDIHFVTGQKVVRFYRVMWYLLPLLGWGSLIIVLTKYQKANFKNDGLIGKLTDQDWLNADLLSWSFAAIAIVAIMAYTIFRMGKPNLLIFLLKPQFYWGPADVEARTMRKNFWPETAIRSQLVFFYTQKNEFPTMISSQLTTAFSRGILREQVKRGGVVSDKTFLPSIGIFASTEEHLKHTQAIAEEAQKEIEIVDSND